MKKYFIIWLTFTTCTAITSLAIAWAGWYAPVNDHAQTWWPWVFDFFRTWEIFGQAIMFILLLIAIADRELKKS